jgi:GR25 family glycosyltransferase involved in LPS biosynthesis
MLVLTVLAVLVGWILLRHRRTSGHLALPAYVINLDRETARYEAFFRRYRASGLPAQNLVRYPAIDGSSIDIRPYLSVQGQRDLEAIDRRGFRTQHHQLSSGAVGIWLSTIGVWRAIRTAGHDVAMIFEDDAIFDARLTAAIHTMQIPPDADIVLMGHQCVDCEPSPHTAWLRVRRFYELHGYLITARGVQKALALVGPLEKQLDSWLSDLAVAGQLVVYASRDPALVRQDKSFATTIQTPIKVSP